MPDQQRLARSIMFSHDTEVGGVHVKTRIFGGPLLNVGMLVCGIVVAAQIQSLSLAHLPFDPTQEDETLVIAPTPLATSDERTVRCDVRRDGRGSALPEAGAVDAEPVGDATVFPARGQLAICAHHCFFQMCLQ
jgi:hypothetical protein